MVYLLDKNSVFFQQRCIRAEQDGVAITAAYVDDRRAKIDHHFQTFPGQKAAKYQALFKQCEVLIAATLKREMRISQFNQLLIGVQN